MLYENGGDGSVPIERLNGQELYYDQAGSGETIVFFHPPVLPSEIFRPQLEELSRSFRIVVLDIRGHGHSAPTDGTWTFADIIDDAVSLLDRLGLSRVWVCGYSAGAAIAFELALHVPERVKGLIVIGPVPEVRGRALRAVVRFGAATASRGGIPLLAALGAWINTKRYSRFKALLRASRKTNGKDAAAFYREYLRYSCADRLHRLQIPILLVYGVKDHVFGAYADELLSRAPDAHLAYVPNAKHEVPSVQPRELNRLIATFIAPYIEKRRDSR